LFEGADDLCKECGREYCHECLVYPFGPKKAPLCHSCAIAAAGIRKHAGRSRLGSRRDRKRIEKQRKEAAASEREPEPVVEVTTMDIGPALRDDLDDERTPAGVPIVNPEPASGIDWTAPFQADSLTAHG
jgi:hypothetical protein